MAPSAVQKYKPHCLIDCIFLGSVVLKPRTWQAVHTEITKKDQDLFDMLEQKNITG